MALQIIGEAIERSKSHDEIVTLTSSDYRPAGVSRDAVIDELLCECEDNTDANGTHEFWGQDCDGAKWRVHVR